MSTPTRGEVPRGNSDGLWLLTDRFNLAPGRIRYHAEAGPEIVATIDRGVLFLMAFWSSPAWQSFSALWNVFLRLRADALELVVVDVDGATDLFSVVEYHGYGEVAWIRDRRIVSTSGRGLRPECFDPNTRDLLALP